MPPVSWSRLSNSKSFGAIVHNVDLVAALKSAERTELRSLLWQQGLLVFPEQRSIRSAKLASQVAGMFGDQGILLPVNAVGDCVQLYMAKGRKGQVPMVLNPSDM